MPDDRDKRIAQLEEEVAHLKRRLSRLKARYMNYSPVNPGPPVIVNGKRECQTMITERGVRRHCLQQARPGSRWCDWHESFELSQIVRQRVDDAMSELAGEIGHDMPPHLTVLTRGPYVD